MDASSGLSWTDGLTQAAIGYGLTIVVAMAVAGAISLIVYTLEALQKKKQVAATPTAIQVALAPEPEKVDETARHVAVVAAAVYAALGAARLVYIGETAPGGTWTSTGRTIQQTSHMPRRSPKR